MKNKVLIKLNIPKYDISFDLFIPVNEYIWRIKKLMIKAISDMLNVEINEDLQYLLINKDNCNIYNNNDIVINTDIRNCTELFLIDEDY